jgi:FKBP-type peptidyl-prolyl cis-trans isomerase SlyD
MGRKVARSAKAVADGVVVSLEYVLRSGDGRVLENSEGQDPFEFLPGGGQLIPALEKQLYGMTVGDQKLIVLETGEAYGEVDPALFQRVDDAFFPEGFAPQLGMKLRLRDTRGEFHQALVVMMAEDGITLDFNHPLAGMQLQYDLKVVGLRKATAAEIEQGHPDVRSNETAA